MKKIHLLLLLTFTSLIIFGFNSLQSNTDIFLSYQVNLKKQKLKLYWKDDKNQPLKSILNLKTWLTTKHQTLLFATNAGMYKVDNSPLGLFIQDGKVIEPLNKKNAAGNFYWKPNGVMYIDSENNCGVCKTEDFGKITNVTYATQSGPMLVYDGIIHPDFKKNSNKLNIRNGVGVLTNNELIFVMSKKEVNLYDFAKYFKDMGCKNALSFDGFVCRTYLPEKNWIQTDGNFGVMIGVTR